MPGILRSPKHKKFKYKLKGPSVIILILLGMIFYSFGGQMVKMYNVQHEITNIQEQMNQLKVNNDTLKKQLEQLNSEAYIEREAREKLGLVKPGEKIILEARTGEKGSTIPAAAKNPKQIEVH
ncbi:FtsB family cell division protein [Phosphitispora fastidiosa]|uniref:FtsB family cell division protein n=1 Tax=Phosphitispora fastidiosa TaxID=2837202 RepID=UPI0022B0CBA9|nr:septum formation initiator family protein [Phosphitispora fastidiosa]